MKFFSSTVCRFLIVATSSVAWITAAKKDGSCLIKEDKFKYEGCDGLNNNKCAAEVLCVRNEKTEGCEHVCDSEKKKTCKKQKFKGEKMCQFVVSSIVVVGGPGGSVHVCGEKRTVPNGSVPIKNIPQIRTGEWGLVDDENPGANPDNYQRVCTNNGYPLPVGDPGKGHLSNLAIGQCNDPIGCPLYRVFDVKPDYESSRRLSSISNERNLLIAPMEGRSWTPLVALEDASGEKGKTFSEYAQDAGICRWAYKTQKLGEQGSIGGFLVRCNVPSGDLFFFW